METALQCVRVEVSQTAQERQTLDLLLPEERKQCPLSRSHPNYCPTKQCISVRCECFSPVLRAEQVEALRQRQVGLGKGTRLRRLRDVPLVAHSTRGQLI